MQVVILCGGLGSRIREVDPELPKPLIPIGGRPIVWHIMKHFSQHGFNDFVLCLGYKSHVIKQYFLDYYSNACDITVDLRRSGQVDVHHHAAEEPWRVTLAETGRNAMTGCRVKRIEKYITGDEFVVTYGDGVSNVDLKGLVSYHHAEGRLATVTAVPQPGRFGEMKLRGSKVSEFAEKPAQSAGFINAGFFVFHREVFDWLADDPSLVLEQKPLTGLAKGGHLSAFRHDGFWHCMDNSRDYTHLNELWDADRAPWKTWADPEQKKLRIAA
jgi:glucose-1-phosphate cytidylyltransferase